MTHSDSEPYGIFGSIWSSLKSHVEERFKSPFAGAFLFAWIAVNWKQLLILILSEISIEERITRVAPHFQHFDNLVLLPLLGAVIVAIFYYAAAIIFMGMSQGYRLVAGWVQRKFESREWMPAPRFAQLKSKYLLQIEKLNAVAADNINELAEASAVASEARVDAANARVALEALRGEINLEKSKSTALVTEKSILETQLQVNGNIVATQARKIEAVKKTILPVRVSIEENVDLLLSINSVLEGIKSKIGQPAVNRLAELAGVPHGKLSVMEIADIQVAIEKLVESLGDSKERIGSVSD